MGGIGWEVRERFKREGMYAYLWPIHVDAWQKQTDTILESNYPPSKKFIKILSILSDMSIGTPAFF